MGQRIGIRQEDSYAWERRAPLIPQDVKELRERNGLEILVQSSPKRVFSDEDYRQAGIKVVDDLSSCPVIFGIKEIPIPVLERGKTYIFFSHTIKGQSYNMPMLHKLLALGCTLIDYEKITDENGHRLIFFGKFAGLAGMIETLWAFGKRLSWEGIETPFVGLKRPIDYADLERAKKAVRAVGQRIASGEIPPSLTPLVVGVAGYGNVSRGAQDLLPVKEIAPVELPALRENKDVSPRVVYKVVFKEQDMVEPIDADRSFELQDYYTHPERYRGVFAQYLPHLDILVNCIYWEPRYPRLVTKDWVRHSYPGAQLRVIGDISCDVEGAIEPTIKATEPDVPAYVYNPVSDRAIDGVEGPGPVIMAIDILPTELPRESSAYFSGVLKKYAPAIAAADYSEEFASCQLPPEIKRAVIAYRGELTPDYHYLEKYLSTMGNTQKE